MNKIEDGHQLNVEQVHDVDEIYSVTPYIKVSRNAFINMVIDCPPQVKLKNHKQIEQTMFMSDIMTEYYLPFSHQIYDWIKTKGIYPWYQEKITGTEFSIPVIPPIGSGYIVTYLNTRHKQSFKWFWNDSDKPYGKMKFRYKSKDSKPDIFGNLRSDIVSVLSEYKTVKIIRSSTEIGAHGQARPQHILEYKPPRNAIGDDNLTTLESFGEDIAGIIQTKQEGLRRKRMKMRTDELQFSIMQQIAINQGISTKLGVPSILKSESRNSAWQRENASLLDKAVPLPADYVYKAVSTPKIAADLEKAVKRFDTLIAAVMDFPKQMLEAPSGNKNTDVSSKRFLNGRIKDWNHFLQKELKHVFMEIHKDDIKEGFKPLVKARKRKGDFNPIYVNDEVEIIMPCSTIASYDDLKEMYTDGIMNKETFGKHAFTLYGLSPNDMDISKDREPEAILKKRKIKEK